MAKKPDPYGNILLTPGRDAEITRAANEFLDLYEIQARAGQQKIEGSAREKLEALAKAKGFRYSDMQNPLDQYFKSIHEGNPNVVGKYFYSSELPANETTRRVAELLTKKARTGVDENEELELQKHIQDIKNTSNKPAQDIDEAAESYVRRLRNYDRYAKEDFVRHFISEPERMGVDIHLRDKNNQVKQNLKEAFIRAGWRQDTVTPELTSELIGKSATLYRSKTNPAAKSADMTEEAKRIVDVVIKKSRNEPIDENTKAAFEKDILSVSEKSGLEEKYVRTYIQQLEADLAEAESHSFIRDPKYAQMVDTSRVDELLKIKARGRLSEEQEAELAERMAGIAKAIGYSQRVVLEDASQYIDFIKRQEEINKKVSQTFVGGVLSISQSAGHTGGPRHIVIPKLQNSYDIFWNPDDRPSKAPPGTPEQWQLLIDYHEAEHIMGGESDRGADEPALDFMRDMNRPDMEKYWLQWRHIESIQVGLEDGFQHDSATFYRVYDRHKQQPDMETLAAAKMELIERIDKKMKNRTEAKIGDIMGAVRDVLKEDDKEKDPAKKLSPIARDQAEMFMRDAKDVGFKANTHYAPQKSVEPVLPIPGESPSAPASQKPAM